MRREGERWMGLGGVRIKAGLLNSGGPTPCGPDKSDNRSYRGPTDRIDNDKTDHAILPTRRLQNPITGFIGLQLTRPIVRKLITQSYPNAGFKV